MPGRREIGIAPGRERGETPVGGGGGDPQTKPVLEVPTRNRPARETTLKAELAATRSDLDSLEKELLAKQTEWEKSKRTGVTKDSWTVLTINSAQAEKQNLQVLDDGSILASGENPKNDVYTLSTETDLAAIGSMRLEALRHESLSGGGLARSDRGNFVLTDFQVRVQPLGGKATQIGRAHV